MTRAEASTLLGLSPAAERADVERQFRALVKRHHPDVATGDPDAASRFGRLVEARSRLLNPAPDPSEEQPPAADATPPPAGTVHILVWHLRRGGTVEVEIRKPCPICDGTGWRRWQFIRNWPFPCPTCQGRGEQRQTADLLLPKHLIPGHRILLDGERLVIVPVIPPPFTAKGPHLLADHFVKASLFQKGGRFTYDAPHVRSRIRLEPQTSPGTIMRIQGYGLPTPGGGRGDLFLRLLAKR